MSCACVDDDDEAKPKAAAAMKVDAHPGTTAAGLDIASSATLSGGVRIVGAMDLYGVLINGVYEATTEISGDMPVYVKVGNNNVCMEYHVPTKSWLVKETLQKGGNVALALCTVPSKCLPEKCPTGMWKEFNGSDWIMSSAISISLVSREEVKAYREEMKREAARVVRGRHNVCITGATGVKADLINGVYKPTYEICGNATVYTKVGNDGVFVLEYSLNKQWQVRPKDANHYSACCYVSAKCLPEECPAGKWYVLDTAWVSQRAITVSLHDNDDDDNALADNHETKPKAAAAAKVDTDPTTKTAGVDSAPPSSSSSGGVRITGAMGPNGTLVNGMYEATTEMSGDMPVYVKVGNNEVCMEYRDGVKSWQVKETAHKGSNGGIARCNVPARCLPEACPVGKWGLCAGFKMVHLPGMTVSLVSKDEVDAYHEEMKREATRVVRGSHNIRITGVTGTSAAHINGVYKPTNEMCGNATVYQKIAGGEIWLEYNASRKQWQVKETEHKNTVVSWAFCYDPMKCLPQECLTGKWYVLGESFLSQRAVTISLHDDDEAKPKAGDMEYDLEEGIRIAGAMSSRGTTINGVYQATNEMSGDMPVYVKVGNNDVRIEYNA